MNYPFFSIVIPLYNKERSIIKTIQSVFAQQYENYEILVINDGSTDNSLETVKKIQNYKTRIISQVNQGVSAARNKGIKEAKYEWIAFLDGDDVWESNHLEEIVKMMNIYPKESVYVTSFSYSDNRVLFKHNRETSVFLISNYFLEATSEILMWTSIVVSKKEALLKIGGFNPLFNRGEDLDVWVKLAKNYNIVKNSENTAIYRVEAENRAYLSDNLERAYINYLPFEMHLSKYEYKYYEFLLFQNMLAYLRAGKFKIFVDLIKRYRNLNYLNFLVFSCKSYSDKFISIFR